MCWRCTPTAWWPPRLRGTAALDATIRLWDTNTWAKPRLLLGHANGVTSVAFSRDGRLLASGSADLKVKLWNVAAAREEKSMTGHTGQVNCVAWSTDGKWIVSAGGREVRLWDPKTGAEAASLVHHSGAVQGMSVDPGGRMIASGSIDLQVKIWAAVPGGTSRLKPKGFFGVSLDNTAQKECVVAEVLVGTAAEAAGMQVGDVIVAVDGVKVADYQEAIAAIGSHSEGDAVEFSIRRAGADMKVKAKLGKRPDGQ